MDARALVENLPHLLAMAVLIAISGLISGGETALFALSRQQLNRLRKSQHALAHLVLRLREDTGTLLTTVLLSNITVNILLFSMLAVTSARLAGGSALWAAVLGTLGFLIVLFGAEVIPKLVAYALSDSLAMYVAVPIRLLEALTFPARWVLTTFIVEPILRLLSDAPARAAHVRAEELQQLVGVCRTEGLIDERENALLHRVMELKALRVSALMIPRVDVIAFNLAHNKDQLRELIASSRLLRIPVYEGDIDHVQGIILSKEFLLNRDRPLKQLIRPVPFIPEQASVEALLQHFRTTGSKLALVVDEYGGVAGIIALEDVVEAIVGEIYAPEEISVLPPLYCIDDTTYLVDAGLDADEFRRALGLPVEETRVNTVGGLIAEALDRVPRRGDEVVIGHAMLTVIAMKDRRILRARLTLDQPVPDNPELSLLLKRPHQAVLPSPPNARRPAP